MVTAENPEPPSQAEMLRILEEGGPQALQAVIESARQAARAFDATRERDWSSPTNSVWGPMWL